MISVLEEDAYKDRLCDILYAIIPRSPESVFLLSYKSRVLFKFKGLKINIYFGKWKAKGWSRSFNTSRTFCQRGKRAKKQIQMSQKPFRTNEKILFWRENSDNKKGKYFFVCLFLCLIFNFYIFIPSSQTKSQKCGIYFFHISHQKEREVFQGVFIINLILFFILTHCVRVYYYLTSSLPSSESSLSFTSLPSPFSLFLRVYLYWTDGVA